MTESFSAAAGVGPLPGASGGSSGSSKNIASSKDQFLQLLLAQMKHQDPLAPPDASKFGEQMTAFGQLEQLFNINASMSNLSQMQGQSTRSQAISMIGKGVSAEANGIAISGTDRGKIGFNLDKNASQVDVSLYNQDGQRVRSFSMSNQPEGVSVHDFDGLDDAGAPLPDGGYSLKIEAASPDGSLVTVKPVFSGKVTGVEFVGGQSVIECGSIRFGMDQVMSVRG